MDFYIKKVVQDFKAKDGNTRKYCRMPSTKM